tara:strand:+ start:25207 stop:25731 length:525 start_codon:yes stop_codon:yes gene_type:complete
MIQSTLFDLEKKAAEAGYLLRIQVRRPLNLWSFKVVVAETLEADKVKILGEMKGWAYYSKTGLQLDTMRVLQGAPSGVGHLIWAATMAWALEMTPCKKARLLAIFDDDSQHSRLTNYFSKRKFHLVREVRSSLFDLPLRLIWGGAGSLMLGDCAEVFKYSFNLLESTRLLSDTN